ncbi:unnamed protein product [Lampetra fluviatilis]
MEDSSLLALRRRVGGPEEGRERTGSWLPTTGGRIFAARPVLPGPIRAVQSSRSHRTVVSVPSHMTDRPGGLALGDAHRRTGREYQRRLKTEEEAEPWDPGPDVRERAGSWDSEVVAHAQAGVGL